MEVTCPTCGSVIDGHLAPATDQAGDTPTTDFIVDAVHPAVAATPAAVAHAEATGVDLTQVEGSGAGGQVIKSDVVAVNQAPVEEPK